MEEQSKVPVFKASLIYGIIVGLASIVIGLILYFIDMSLEPWAGYFSTIVFVLLIVGSLVMFRKEYGKGFAKFGQLVLVSFLVGLFASILSAGYTYVIYQTDEGYLQDTKYLAIERMDKQLEKRDLKLQQRLSDEQYAAVEERMDEARKIGIDRIKKQTPMKFAISGLFGSVFMAVIVGLIAAIFIKKDPEPLQH